MPELETIERARQDQREGEAASTQAGEFVREEFHHIREGKHGARSPQQAIAIGLSKARRAGVPLPPPPKGKVSEKARRSAERAYQEGQAAGEQEPSPTRSRAISGVLKKEGTQGASHAALSRQAATAAWKRTPAERSASSRQVAQTRIPAERSASARKAARTRARRQHAR
jgi:hypothetical protein